MSRAAEVDPSLRTLLSYDRAQIRAPASWNDVTKFRAFLDAPLLAIKGNPVSKVHDLTIRGSDGDVPLRLYYPERSCEGTPATVFMHGGGFVAGSLDTHDALCRALCRASGSVVVAVQYRLAPEHPCPAALEDCMSALHWIMAHGGEEHLRTDLVSLCGDSAGGYLALRMGAVVRDTGLPVRVGHIGLLYPVVDPGCDTSSMHALAEGFVLTRGAMKWFWRAFAGEREQTAELSLLNLDLSGLPPVSMVIAGYDPLKDEEASLADRLSDAGVVTSTFFHAGMIHGFASLPHITPAAEVAVSQISAAMRAG
ncbi:alpha/beta hydrolase [Sphingomonas sp. ID0503]|uniref:alpha/beta hydrolase n=1 Tax=Sphingomonas sp. ID0503 TaxID=3399691 RepID=UPI003AFAA1F8